MIQQRLNLGPQKNLKHVPSSSPNLLIEISKFADQIFHKQSRKRFNKILCHTRTLDSVFYSIQLHIFFSPKILMTYFLHRTKLFVLHTTSPEFVH